jgi:uncharacterized protein YuzB (UPF0349 family)
MASIMFCEQNLKHGADKVIQKLENEYPGADIKVQSMCETCGKCSDSPFALIDGKVFSAETPDGLYESIEKNHR